MLLAIDIGNTNITAGVWGNSRWQRQWRLRTNPERTVDEYGIMLKNLLREVKLAKKISRVVIASVVPSLTATFTTISETYLKQTAVYVTVDLDLGIQVTTDNPYQVGTDRIVNAVAAYHLFQGPAIIIDMGTATKLDVLTAEGHLAGGIIAPGLELSARALTNRAAQLSGVALTAPPNIIGRNTTHAIQSGIIFGYVSLIEGLVTRLLAAHPNKEQPIHIIGTGGQINLIAPHTTMINEVDPWLTLTGLRLIYERVEEAAS